jgi:hypothetical protein
VCYSAVALLFQILLFALTLAKLAGALRRPGSRAPLTTLLARDGTWAFGLILCTSVCWTPSHATKRTAW